VSAEFYAFLDAWVSQARGAWAIAIVGFALLSAQPRRLRLPGVFGAVFASLFLFSLFLTLYPPVLEVCGIHDFRRGLWTTAEIHEHYGNRFLLPALFLKRMCEPVATPWLVNGLYLLWLIGWTAIPMWAWWSRKRSS
jgi:hypothetical protein